MLYQILNSRKEKQILGSKKAIQSNEIYVVTLLIGVRHQVYEASVPIPYLYRELQGSICIIAIILIRKLNSLKYWIIHHRKLHKVGLDIKVEARAISFFYLIWWVPISYRYALLISCPQKDIGQNLHNSIRILPRTTITI